MRVSYTVAMLKHRGKSGLQGLKAPGNTWETRVLESAAENNRLLIGKGEKVG